MEKKRYEIHLSDFHGGGLIGGPDPKRFTKLETAIKAVRRYRSQTDCTCGCYVIYDNQDDDFIDGPY